MSRFRVIGGGVTSLILIGLVLYGIHYYITHSGSTLAKYAVKKNSTCVSEKSRSVDSTDNSDYTECMNELEMLVKNLIESGEINLEDCELDSDNTTIAYCQLTTWYSPKTVVVTDHESVNKIAMKISEETVTDSTRRKRSNEEESSPIFYKLRRNNVDMKLQPKYVSGHALKKQQIGNFGMKKRKEFFTTTPEPTEVKPVAEPPVSKENPENSKENEHDPIESVSTVKLREQPTQAGKYLETQLQRPKKVSGSVHNQIQFL